MIYFVQNTAKGSIKIGYSDDPYKRVQQLQVGSVDPLKILLVMPGGYQEEQELHSMFVDLSERGEWFIPGEGLLQFIEGRKRCSLIGKYFAEFDSTGKKVLEAGRVVGEVSPGFFLLGIFDMDLGEASYEMVAHVSTLESLRFYSSWESVKLLVTKPTNRILHSIRNINTSEDDGFNDW